MDEVELRRQLELCMGCGYCRDAYGEEGWLESLKTKHVCPVREVFGFDSYTAKGRLLLGKAIIEELLPFTSTAVDVFLQCTLCGNCEAHCISRGLPFVPPDLKVREIIRHFREKIVQQGLKIPQPIRKIGNNVTQWGNVFGEESDQRSAPYLSDQKDAKTFYFAGCMATFREQHIIQAFDKLAEKLSLEIGLLTEELCCGNVLLRTGQIQTATQVMEKNLEIFNRLGIETLITSCPGCLSAFKNEYPRYGIPLKFKIQHVAEYLTGFSKLKTALSNVKPIKVTYHDPCELGRLNSIYNPPRELLQLIPNIQIIESFRSHVNSWCCGAGAGVQAGYPDLTEKIAEDRYRELQETDADYIVTACPNCIHALKQIGKIYDIIEFIDIFLA